MSTIFLKDKSNGFRVPQFEPAYIRKKVIIHIEIWLRSVVKYSICGGKIKS